MTGAQTIPNKQASTVILALSAVIVAFLFWLIYFAPTNPNEAASPLARQLPAINAGLNALSATLVTIGILSIKTRRVKAHAICMASATVASALFLIGYITYHKLAGDTKFLTPGPLRYVYFPLLISHIVLSIAVVPMILMTLFCAAMKRWDLHRRIAAFTYPVWLYVSVTGVIVFVFLRMLNTPAG